nr:SH protein [Shanxi Armigeres subalbatus rhabdovirus]
MWAIVLDSIIIILLLILIVMGAFIYRSSIEGKMISTPLIEPTYRLKPTISTLY